MKKLFPLLILLVGCTGQKNLPDVKKQLILWDTAYDYNANLSNTGITLDTIKKAHIRGFFTDDNIIASVEMLPRPDKIDTLKINYYSSRIVFVNDSTLLIIKK